MRDYARLEAVSSTIQVEISVVLQELTDMETGQRGYLLTKSSSYLQPYNAAKARISADFARLRSSLVDRPEHDRAQESQLEALASSKQAEMARTLTMRDQGYRHRAFMAVESGEGLNYMDNARGLITSLATAEAGRLSQSEAQKDGEAHQALKRIIVIDLLLLTLTGILFACMFYQAQALEAEIARRTNQLSVRDLHLRKLTSALSVQARSRTSSIEENARLLLQNYGGFLPRQGHEYAEQIQEASAQMERLRRDLIGDAESSAEEMQFDRVA